MEANGGRSHVAAGPWGGEGGTRWDDGAYYTVRQLIISHGAAIDSVQIEYDANGAAAVWSERHGGRGGVRAEKVKLNLPDEYLVAVSGFYGPVSDYGPTVVRCLVLESNKRRFGPFGSQSGTHFSFTMSQGKIVGFHGRSGNHLDSIGVHLKPLVTVVPAQAHDFLAQARNRGFFRDNMVNINNGGFGGTERKEKFFTGEAVKGNPFYGQMEREKENYTYVASSGYGEYDQAYDDRKVYGYATIESENGYSNTRHSGIEDGQYYFVPSPDIIGFSGYETREITKKTYDTAEAEKSYLNMRQATEDLYNLRQNDNNLVTSNRGFMEYKTKEKVQNPKVSPTERKSAVSYGPWGGSGGMSFDDGKYTGVKEIHLSRSTSGVVSIRVCYDRDGQVVSCNKNGGNTAFRFDKITLDYPNEVLTRISGYYGPTDFRGPIVIKSLTLFTNKKKYGPFGDEQGVPFSSGQNEGVIVGFHGKKGNFLDSIGVHFLEEKYNLSSRSPFDVYSKTSSSSTEVKFSDQKVLPGPVKGPTYYGPKPLGGNGSSPWDDGVFTGIRKITLTKGELINAIQIEYDRNGQSILAVKHGSDNEGSCHVIQFDYPQEVVTRISGYEDELKKVVKSLTFHTNRRKYGPYGEEIGTYFTSPNTDQIKVVGFHGNSGCYLNAIRAHTQQHRLNESVDQTPRSNQNINVSPQYFSLINHF